MATHRHGCCVLQRCIDHASETQKFQLVSEITTNALSLVQVYNIYKYDKIKHLFRIHLEIMLYNMY